MAGIVERLLTQPDILHSLSGGTRNKINLNRPWQPDLPYAPDKCPFCTKSEPEAMESLPGWRVLRNNFTPHAFHRLIIPRECPTREETRLLCGTKAIEEALTVYSKVIPVAEDEGFERTVFAAHIGALAGQSFGHLHWHVCDLDEPAILIEKSVLESFDQRRLVFERHGFMVYAEGSRSGHLYLVSRAERHVNVVTDMVDLASVISDVIILCNSRFLSSQGLSPDYLVAVVSSGYSIRYATYFPILNQLGFPHVLAMSGDSKIVLPWPHEVTAAYLRGEKID